MKYQVVVLDQRDYIISYEHFTDTHSDIIDMINYVEKNCRSKNGYEIRITKWDSVTGERIK